MFWPHLLTSFRCASVFPPLAPSSKFCPQSRPPCWVAPTSAKRSQSRWVFITALWSISWNGSFQPPSSPHLSYPIGYRDVGPQRSEPDAVCKGDGQGGGGSFHQDPNRRRLHPPLGQKDPLVPVRHWAAVPLLHGGATEPSGRTLNGQIHILSELWHRCALSQHGQSFCIRPMSCL